MEKIDLIEFSRTFLWDDIKMNDYQNEFVNQIRNYKRLELKCMERPSKIYIPTFKWKAIEMNYNKIRDNSSNWFEAKIIIIDEI